MKKIFYIFFFLLLSPAYALEGILNEDAILRVDTEKKQGEGVVLSGDGTFIVPFGLIATAEKITVKTNKNKTYEVDAIRYINPDLNYAILSFSKNKNLPIAKFNEDKKITFDSGASISLQVFNDHIRDKKIINSKKINWAEFVANSASSELLASIIEFAIKTDNPIILLNYSKAYIHNVDFPSSRYSLMGVFSLVRYLKSNLKDKEALYDARRMFALSINANTCIRSASYGYFIVGYLEPPRNPEVNVKVLKKCPALYAKAVNQGTRLLKSGNITPENNLGILHDMLFTLRRQAVIDYKNAPTFDYKKYFMFEDVSSNIDKYNKIASTSKKPDEIKSAEEELIMHYLYRSVQYQRMFEWGKATNDLRSTLYLIKYSPYIEESDFIKVTPRLEELLDRLYKKLNFKKSKKNRLLYSQILNAAGETRASLYEYYTAISKK